MPEHKSLAAALCAAQAEMKHAVLDKTNPHFKSKYASLASVIDASRVLSAHGVIAKQRRVQKEDGGWVLRTWLEHVSGERDEWFDEQSLDEGTVQQRGSSLTYARRYGLSTVAGIASEDDDDGNAASETPKKNASQVRKSGLYTELEKECRLISDLGRLKDWWAARQDDIRSMPAQHRELIEEEKDRRKLQLADALTPSTIREDLKKSLALTEEEAEVIDPPDPVEVSAADLLTNNPQEFLDDLADAMSGAADEAAVLALWEEYVGIKEVLPPAAQKQAQLIFEHHRRRAKANAAVEQAQHMREEGKKK